MTPCQQTGQAQPDLLRLAEDDVLERRDCRVQTGRGTRGHFGCRRVRLLCARGVHGRSSPCMRSSWVLRPAMARSSSATRSRSLATTSSGALRTKLSFDSLPRILVRS